MPANVNSTTARNVGGKTGLGALIEDLGPMAIPAGLAVGQFGLGIFNKLRAGSIRNQANREFDRFQVPDSINNMLGVIHGLSSQTEIPGANIYREQAKAGMSQGLETGTAAAESSTDVLGVVRDMFKSYTDFERNMGAKGAEMQYNSKMKELDVLKTIGDYETQEWMYNELYPYMQSMNTAGQMSAAGNSNINSALSAGMNIGMTKWDMDYQKKMFDAWKEAQLDIAKEKAKSNR